MTVEIGQPAPDFSAEATGDRTLSLADFKGKTLILYFYPKDNTPGCTQEGQDFRDLYPAFQDAGAEVLGVSRESLKSHANFKAKHEFPFDLLSDPDEIVCKAYDVMKEKNMYGRKYMGVERSTFLIDGDGRVREAWRKVKVKGHAQAVLDAIKAQ